MTRIRIDDIPLEDNDAETDDLQDLIRALKQRKTKASSSPRAGKLPQSRTARKQPRRSKTDS